MTPSGLDDVIERARDAFPDGSIESRVCNFVLTSVSALGPNLDGLRLGDVVSALGLQRQAEAQAVARAMDLLSIGPDAVLERRFEYWPDDDGSVLLDVIPIDPADVRDALLDGVFHDPRTGAVVPNFKDLISIIYELSDRSRALLERSS
jgi:hypothetical protein